MGVLDPVARAGDAPRPPGWVHDCLLDHISDGLATRRAADEFVLNERFASLLTREQRLMKEALVPLSNLYQDKAVRGTQSWDTIAELLSWFGQEFVEDDEGYAVYVKLKYYVRYLLLNDDDSPLYVFDSSFADREGTRALRRDYALPAYFTDDLFKLVGERRRPPYRWWVLGPERSGSYIHIDPLGTSAWNALLTGHKCWALFPPATPKEVVAPKHAGGREAISWWRHVYPTLVHAADPAHRPMTVIQRPGETVFVPGGWWHVVLNLDVAMAVTQNFSTSARFDAVWRITRRARPKMSGKWLEKLRLVRPDLAAVADAQPRRSEASAGEKTSSTSSSSTGSSDNEEEENETTKKEREMFQRAGASGNVSPDKTKRSRAGDEKIAELAKEKIQAANDAMEI